MKIFVVGGGGVLCTREKGQVVSKKAGGFIFYTK